MISPRFLREVSQTISPRVSKGIRIFPETQPVISPGIPLGIYSPEIPANLPLEILPKISTEFIKGFYRNSSRFLKGNYFKDFPELFQRVHLNTPPGILPDTPPGILPRIHCGISTEIPVLIP